MDNNKYLIGGGVLAVFILVYFLFFTGGLEGRIVLPYVSHQQPMVDPHLPSNDLLAENIDEVLFDGLFNKSATASGEIFEDGLGTLISFQNNIATVKLHTKRLWHSSYTMEGEGEDTELIRTAEKTFSANDVDFSLRRIKRLESLSPDYVMVHQALKEFAFSGPNEKNEIMFQFREDRIWTEDEVKECLSFKILPSDTKLDETSSFVGSGPYIRTSIIENEIFHKNNPETETNLHHLLLNPFIDNSTFSTELDNENINVLFSTPYGSLNPILNDSTKYFYKSNISTTFFALFFNTERVSLEKRRKYRALLNNKDIMDRFYRVNTPQQRHITDYKGNSDNYEAYLNSSVFPKSSYYVSEKIVTPNHIQHTSSISVNDTLNIKVHLGSSFNVELSELTEILNDQNSYGQYIRVTKAEQNDIVSGNYDAVLLPVEGYRSNFLFDLYQIFLRDPNLNQYKINLNQQGGEIDLASVKPETNFFRLSGLRAKELYEAVYGFMSTSEIGDKQYYSAEVDRLEHEMALGAWLFSLPSLTYFSTQFDEASIQLYGTASKLSTIEKWRERPKK